MDEGISLHIRTATLDDTSAIVRLYCSQVERWQRLSADGLAEDIAYEALTVYERWLHGGHWLSIETAVLWLSHLLRGAGLPLVIENQQQSILGYAEVFHGDEPAPIGKHLHLGALMLAPHAPADAAQVLLNALSERSAPRQRLLTSLTAYDEANHAFYAALDFVPLQSVTHYSLSTQAGQGFYKAVEHRQSAAEQIATWGMPIGRSTSARQAWETHWTALWDAVPQIAAHKMERISLNASGQPAFVCYQTRLYDPRTADVLCWTPKALTSALLVAIRDWGQRQGYRTLVMAVNESTAKLLGADASPTPMQHLTFVRDL